MRRSNYLSPPSDHQRHIRTLRLSRAAWLLIVLCGSGAAHAQTNWGSSSTDTNSYVATYSTYSDDTFGTGSDYTALAPRQSSRSPSSHAAPVRTYRGSTSRRSTSATARSTSDLTFQDNSSASALPASSFHGNAGTVASRAAWRSNRSATDPTSTDYMGQSDTDTGSQRATTSSPMAGTRANSSASRLPEKIDAVAPGVYPGTQYNTNENASALYAPLWKANPYPVY